MPGPVGSFGPVDETRGDPHLAAARRHRENHGDHQASGVLATEAFDMAGDVFRTGCSRERASAKPEPLGRSAALATSEDLLLLECDAYGFLHRARPAIRGE